MYLLLVEDDAQLAEAICDGVRQHGWTIDRAGDAASARTLLVDHPYAAVLLDIGLPGDSGLSVLKAMRERYDATPVRIGYNGYGPRPPHKTPPAVYVHADNPLAGLTLAQVSRIFTDGHDGGDLTTWSQLGLDGSAWTDRRIHAYGLRDDGGFATGAAPRAAGAGQP
ncbi:response regulator, partial [Xanthomonas sp. Kuri4-3]